MMPISSRPLKPSNWSLAQALVVLVIGTFINAAAFGQSDPTWYWFIGGIYSGVALSIMAVWIDDEKVEKAIDWLSPKRAYDDS